MDRGEKEKAWQAFWARQRSASGPAVVSFGGDPLCRAQFNAWTDFCSHLGKGARVLDLGTGSGKLPQLLQIARPDLSIVGVDLAKALPAAPEGIELIGGVSMEDLPFEEDQFDAAVSQFGFEYGDPDAISGEILRVVKANGPIGLMVHRGDGPILKQNLQRQEQISWAMHERRLFAQTLEMLPEDNTLANAAVQFAQDLASEGSRRFGRGSVAWELPEAVRRALLLGPNGTREKLVGTLELIAGQAEEELRRIRSLAEACAAADDRQRLISGLEKQGRCPIATVGVQVATDAPFADFIML